MMPTGCAWNYCADGQPDSMSAPNGNTIAYGYDSVGQLSSMVTTNSGGTPAAYTWTRNRAGQVLTEDSEIDNDPANGTTTYTYDPLARLNDYTRAGSTTSYAWQAVPNLDSVSVDNNPQVTYTYGDNTNRQTDSSLGTITYNGEGQLTDYPGQTLEWNDLGQLTTVRDASTNDVIASYTYDALDRLLTVEHPGVDDIRFRYVGLSTEVAQVVDDATDDVIYSVANGWNGNQLFQWDASSETFYGTNAHHDVTWTADSSGDVSATLRYDPWGSLTDSSGSHLPAFRFQGSWFDPTVDLYSVVARWYAPAMARFISEDPAAGILGQADSIQRYTYASGDPVDYGDTTGLLRCAVCGGGGGHLKAFWHVVRPGDTAYDLARIYFGNRRFWPIVFNMNRSAFTWPDDHPIGQCVWIAAPGGRKDECQGNGISGNDAGYSNWVRQYRDQATATLDVNWWMLTTDGLLALTEKTTQFHNGSNPRYAKNLFWPTMHALALAGVDGATIVKSLPRVLVLRGTSRTVSLGNVFGFDFSLPTITLPPSRAAAITIGAVTFLRDEAYMHDDALMGHEYIHVMQYAANSLQEVDYLAECGFVVGWSDCGNAKNPYEAIAYLWTAWMDNYQRYGGPTAYSPQWYWQTPKFDDVIKAAPWPF